MTYTFKLSRRLAISRYAMLAAAALLLSCDAETTAPESDLKAPSSATPWIRVVPSAVTVEINQPIHFRGERRSPRGEAHNLRLTWHASGGTITEDGLFTSSAAGVYKVIGRGRGRNKPDTSVVVVVPPPVDLVGVSVDPDTATLPMGGTHTFTATGRRSDGSLVAIGVTWRAGGGSIDAGGAYTAGNGAGAYQVIALSTDSTLADTATVTITDTTTSQPPPPPPPSLPPPPPPSEGPRILIGASQLWSSLGEPGTETFTLTHDGVRAAGIIQRIADARSKNVRLLLNMTGGHDPYMSTINGVYQFDMEKWRDSMATYNTAAIKDAVARAVADGIIIGNSVMDEPHVDGSGVDGNTWGPKGTMTKVRVDSMCAYVKAIFPTMPVGVVHQHQLFEPTKSYRVCEFLVDQYVARLGTPESFRDGALAMARRDGMRILFGSNELNGGPQDRDGTWDCRDQGGYKGQSAPNCQVPPDSMKRWYPLLARAGCAFRVWRWDDVRANTTAYRAARLAVADSLAGDTGPTCARP